MSETIDTLSEVLEQKKPDFSNNDLVQELFPGAKVEKFENIVGPRWEEAHEKRGAEISDFLGRLNETHFDQNLNIDSYITLLEEANLKIESLITPKFIEDPISIQSDNEYAYIWNNTHKNIFNSLISKAENMTDEEKNALNIRLLDHMMHSFGKYPIEIEQDRQRYIFRAIENTWTEETAGQVRSFYTDIAREPSDVEDSDMWSFEYSSVRTHEVQLQDLILHSCTQVLDQDETSVEVKKGVVVLLDSMMEDHVFGKLKRYVGVFEKIGPNYSVEPLLQGLRSENEIKRRLSAEILFRLELGKIGVSEEGVEYLGKLYDLGKFNDPEFFVRRLNNSGLMAVLDDEKGSIKGVFPLDLNAQEDIIKTEVRQLISQELFLPKADETPKQREEREEYLKLFMENYESIFNDDFFEGTNVRLNSLALYEQGWFLMYYLELSEKDDKEGLEKLKDFVSKYGEYGLKAFLALDYCKEPGVIMEFADCSGISDEHKLDIFKTYNQIERISYEYRSLFEKLLSEGAKDFGTQLHEAFIRNSSEFLLAATLIAEGTEKEVSIQELLRGMNDIAKTMIGFKKILENSDSTELWRIPQYATEYDKDGNKLESATASFIFIDKSLNTRTSVFMRPQPTVRVGNSYGGEARININTAHLDSNGKVLRQSRVAVDLSDYGEYIGDSKKEPVVALDFCLDPIDPENTDQGDELTRLLKSVPTYQGHHNERSFSQNLPQHFPEVVENFWSFMENNYKRNG